MTAPATAVRICNIALGYVQSNVRVADVTTAPTSPEEILCNQFYDQCRRMALENGNWNFAMKRATCPRAPDESSAYWDDYYVVPNDLIKLRFIGDDSSDMEEQNYQIENGFILMNNSGATSIPIGYTFNQEDVTKFSPLFVDCVALELAVILAASLAKKPGIQDRVEARLDKAYLYALGSDGQQRPPKIVRKSKFLSPLVSRDPTVVVFP